MTLGDLVHGGGLAGPLSAEGCLAEVIRASEYSPVRSVRNEKASSQILDETQSDSAGADLPLRRIAHAMQW
jgi:hypothetical protein